MSTARALFSALLVTLLSACATRGGGRLARVSMPNPMRSGALANAIPLRIEDGRDERHFRLPAGSLADEAVLALANSSELCFDLVVRDPEPQWASLSSYQVRVLSSTHELPLEGSATQLEPAQESVVPGVSYHNVPSGSTRTRCVATDRAGICIQSQTDPVMVTVAEPDNFSIHQAQGRACFPNHRIVTADTTWLRLRVIDPQNPSGRVWTSQSRVGLNFEWTLQ